MNDRELREKLKAKEIYNQYLLIGDEPLLIDNAVAAIKDAVAVDQAFDLDVCSISDTPPEDIAGRLFTMPFSSSRRVIVVKNIEELDKSEVLRFSKMIGRSPASACLVMTYLREKQNAGKRAKSAFDNAPGIFPEAQYVYLIPDKEQVRKWIANKMRRLKVELPEAMARFLEEEFSNDITALKCEFDKIENYLYEAKQLKSDAIRELARGLSDYDKYRMASIFMQGRTEALVQFEEIRPYVQSLAEIVDSLTRAVNHYSQSRCDGRIARSMLDDIAMIDGKVKTGSSLTDVMLELFMVKNLALLKKGVTYGR
jgi:DNA polymerase III delta subunit